MKWMRLQQLLSAEPVCPVGKGNMFGTALGAILMATIKNGLSLLNVNTFWHQVVIGLFILFAVALDGFAAKKAN